MPDNDPRPELAKRAPTLTAAISRIVEGATAAVRENLEADRVPKFPKTVNDAVWGTVELRPDEVMLLDCALLQRLRGIRQLGMAHLVYPGAGYDRLEHSIGVVESARQIVDALQRNAENRRLFGEKVDESIPQITPTDLASIRLGALLHDVGHTPFSHATEHLIPREFPKEYEAAEDILRATFDGVTGIQPAELVAVLMVLSEPMTRIIEHVRFPVRSDARDKLTRAIAARILGSRSFLKATYLSGVVSGPLDADKIDYMARDSHHAGLPLGLDLMRLVSKLEVVTVTTENAIAPEVRKRADANPNKRFYELGLSRAGLGAYEQLVIARVMLYERLYYHHKVRVAEGMVRNLIDAVGVESKPLKLEQLYCQYPDDAVIDILGAQLAATDLQSGKDEAKRIRTQLRSRTLHHRAYSFSSRFITNLGSLPKKELDATRALLWSSVTGQLESFDGCRALRDLIYDKCVAVGKALAKFSKMANELVRGDIIVDLPKHDRVARGGDLLVTSETGHVATPNMFFQADRWGDAYMQQKQIGHVFAPRPMMPLVSLASRIVFYDQFKLVMGIEADVSSKTAGSVDKATLDELSKTTVCSAECLASLKEERIQLVRVRPEHIKLPDAYAKEDPNLAKRLAAEFDAALPVGLPASVHEKVMGGIHAMLKAIQITEEQAKFRDDPTPDEVSELQPQIRSLLRAADVDVDEASKIGGGQMDLILFKTFVLENKVAKTATDDPFAATVPASWQARRYSIPLAQSVSFICSTYQPKTETGHLRLSERVLVRESMSQDGLAEVVFVIPCGYGAPHDASKRAPEPSKS